MNHSKLVKKNMQNTTQKQEKIYYSVNNQAIEIDALVYNAAKCIAPVWPLTTFIACNPLQGFETENFEKALTASRFMTTAKASDPRLAEVNQQMFKWCSSFFDDGQSKINLPNREHGFYLSFLKLSCFDAQLHKNNKGAREFLKSLPNQAEQAIKISLQKLHVPVGQEEEFLALTLQYLPGWAGFVKWHNDWQNDVDGQKLDCTISDFLAVRLIITYILWPEAAKQLDYSKSEFTPTVEFDKQSTSLIAQLKSNELQYRQKLLNCLLSEANKTQIATDRKIAQMVFCIDVRSEPFRRAIESLGEYETFGFAGFFGIPIHTHEFEENHGKDCCPVLLKPKFTIAETPCAANNASFTRFYIGKALINTLKNIYSELKNNFSTPFALAESLGIWCGVNMVLKSLSANISKNLMLKINNWLKPSLATTLNYETNSETPEIGLSLQDQIIYAATVLRLMGLTSNFAKLILLCGHGSTTENNPYASALDCGACGGNHGGINARLLAAILNKTEVRQGLEEYNIHIPFDSVFYGALHNTTTDEVKIYAAEVKTTIYPRLVEKLQNDLKHAKTLTNKERVVKLNSRLRKKSSVKAQQDILRRSADWSETRPEWGLARNAAFIVGPRSLTANVNLDGRCFLHSYRFEEDLDGTLLETILTAPMVVAEWINTQYLFSTLDNIAFGSGSKITHNVVGNIGVMQGNSSDLMHGLPLQSVMSADDRAFHVPQRLLTVVYAPQQIVENVIAKHSILKNLFFNEWVNLVVINPENNLAYSLDTSGKWSGLSQNTELPLDHGVLRKS